MIGNLNNSATEFLIWLANIVETGRVDEQFRVAWLDGGGLIVGAKLESDDEPITVRRQLMAVLVESQYLSTNDMKTFSITASAYREVKNYLQKMVLEYAYNAEKSKNRNPASAVPNLTVQLESRASGSSSPRPSSIKDSSCDQEEKR